MPLTTLTLDDKPFDFDFGVDDANRYINSIDAQDKVAPSYNLLMQTIKPEQKEELKEVVLVDGKPNGFLCIQIAGELNKQFSSAVKVTLGKPTSSPIK